MDFLDAEIRTYEDHKTNLRYEVKFWNDPQCGPTFDISQIPDRLKIKKMIENIYCPVSNRSNPCVAYSERGGMGVEEVYICTATNENYFVYEPSRTIKRFTKCIYPLLSSMTENGIIGDSGLYEMGEEVDFFGKYVVDATNKNEYELAECVQAAVCSKIDLAEGENILIMALQDQSALISFLLVNNPSDDLMFYAKLLS